MKKLLSLAAALALAAIASVSTATPSSADPAGAAVAGGILGFMAGAAVAGGPHYVYRDDDYYRWRMYGNRWGYRDYAWRRHIRACFEAYPSYDPRSDTFIGRDRRPHRCRL